MSATAVRHFIKWRASNTKRGPSRIVQIQQTNILLVTPSAGPNSTLGSVIQRVPIWAVRWPNMFMQEHAYTHKANRALGVGRRTVYFEIITIAQ